eukprot:jgi/Ulvmu1/6296/UM029_0003.1
MRRGRVHVVRVGVRPPGVRGGARQLHIKCKVGVTLALGSTATLRGFDLRGREGNVDLWQRFAQTALSVGMKVAPDALNAGHACVQAERCTIEHVSGIPVSLNPGARMSMHLCYLNTKTVALQSASAHSVLSRCAVTSAAVGCMVAGASLHVHGCTMVGGWGSGAGGVPGGEGCVSGLTVLLQRAQGEPVRCRLPG